MAELKRLNKIEKEYEIHARNTIKVPITPHTLLLEHIPAVHSSGSSNFPSSIPPENAITPSSSDHRLDITANFDSNSIYSTSEQTINDIILNTEITRNNYVDEFNVKGKRNDW